MECSYAVRIALPPDARQSGAIGCSPQQQRDAQSTSAGFPFESNSICNASARCCVVYQRNPRIQRTATGQAAELNVGYMRRAIGSLKKAVNRLVT